jgi:signal transduction histidine kinase
MTSQRLRTACLALGLALGVVGIVVPLVYRPRAAAYIPLDVTLGWSFIFAGWLAWARRPDNRTGMLMMLTGLVWFGRYLDWWWRPLPSLLSALAVVLTLALVAHQFVVFPSGRARTRPERYLVAAAYSLAVGGFVLTRLFYEPVLTLGCPSCQPNLVLVDANQRVLDLASDAVAVLSIALGAAILSRLLWRWWKATPPARRVLTPIVCAAPVVALVVAINLVQGSFGGLFSPARYSLMEWSTLVYTLIPLAFLAGLLRTRLHRTALAELVVELSRTPPPDQVRDSLARALGDPSLQVGYRTAGLPGWVDADGRAFALPVEGQARAFTVLEQHGEPLAALVYDASLLGVAAFVDAAAAAARLALENGRLQAELRAQLVAVRASRARIVAAGDAERRRLERDLHDGAQQRLLGLRLALQIARGRAKGDQELGQLLADVDLELDGALDELRALARGIHPAVLTEEGLGPALETLCRRSSVPISLEALPRARLPAQVEAAAYFVASEALANVAKHARASRVSVAVSERNGRLHVDVTDDGVGGADPTGHGLVGLRDRVEALSGSLLVDSPRDQGTHLHAELPCG